ncbi:hypothetical protein Hanom_Chr09g00837931 [Helianthus anomalus]
MDSFFTNNVSKELNFFDPKLAFRELSVQTFNTQEFKYKAKVTLMIGSRFRINENVINEDDHEAIQVGLTNTIHEVHEHSGCVGQAKRHNHELVVSIASAKSGFGNVLFENSKLMITRTKIDFGETGSALELVKEIVDTRKRVTILDGEFVELTIIDTHAERTIFLFNEKHGSTPRRGTWTNEAFIEEFLKLRR